MINKEYQICSNCVMDTSDSKISFDENGVCDHCNNFKNNILPNWPFINGRGDELNKIVDEIRKNKPKGSKYDCIMGISGGVDSSYMAYYAKEILGLNPMLYHIDAGWNSDIAVSNIEKICSSLDLDLFTEIINWKEMQDLQRSFFLAQVCHIDTPQDHAFMAGMYRYARQKGFKYILNGGNIATECIREPLEWHYHASDLTQLKDIHQKFGKVKLRSFPLVSIFKYRIFYKYIIGIKQVRFLDFINYNKQDTIEFLKTKFNWTPYKEKHYESRFTKFYEGYWMYEKFGYDIRRAHYSSLILTGQITREEVLKKLEKKPYSKDELSKDFNYIADKLEFSKEELQELFNGKNKTYQDYKNSNNLIDLGAKIMRRLKLENKLYR